MRALLLVLLGIFFYFGCDKTATTQSSVIMWQTDLGPIVKAMPFVNGATASQWTTTINSRSETIPAPGQQVLSGYVVLNEDGLQELVSKYSWNNTDVAMTIPLPQGTKYSNPNGKVLESKDLTSKLPTLSTYHQGKLYLAPEQRVLYFELVKN